jgi:hypothetical protein
MTTTRTTSAIGGSELREGMTLKGDSLCATRYGSGVVVDVVNVECGLVMVIASGRRIELLPAETVYVSTQN